MPDPRRVIAYLEPAAIYERQWAAAKREDAVRQWAPFNAAMLRAYQPAIRAAFGSQQPFDLARLQNASAIIRTGRS